MGQRCDLLGNAGLMFGFPAWSSGLSRSGSIVVTVFNLAAYADRIARLTRGATCNNDCSMSDEAEPTPKVERDDSTPDEPTNDELGTDTSADSPSSRRTPPRRPQSLRAVRPPQRAPPNPSTPSKRLRQKSWNTPMPMIPPRLGPGNRSKTPRNPPNLSGGRA